MKEKIEVRIDYSKEEFCNPVWWDDWVRKNLKKKARSFSKTVNAGGRY